MGLVALLKAHFLCQLAFCYVFVASGLIVNALQVLTLPLWPLSRRLFRKINCRLSYCVSSQLVMLLEWWSGTDCVIHTDPSAYAKFGKENAIVVLNHKFEIDFLCGWSLAERFGVLGASKVLAKQELAYVPIIGWMWRFTEMVFCARRWELDRTAVARSLERLRDYPDKYFFLIHCEGTRFTEKKHRVSMEVAAAKGLPPLKHHLLPRTKGFTITVKSLRDVETMRPRLCWASSRGGSTTRTCTCDASPWSRSRRMRSSALPGCTGCTSRRTPSRSSTCATAASRAPPCAHPAGRGRC